MSYLCLKYYCTLVLFGNSHASCFESRIKVQSRVRTREDEKTVRDRENQKERGGLLEVDDLSQRGASDWSCSQGPLDDLADGQIVHLR